MDSNWISSHSEQSATDDYVATEGGELPVVNGNKGKLRCIERSQYPIFGVIFSAYKIE